MLDFALMSQGKRPFSPRLQPDYPADSTHGDSVRGRQARLLICWIFALVTPPSARQPRGSHSSYSSCEKRFAVSIQDVYHAPRHTLWGQGHQIICSERQFESLIFSVFVLRLACYEPLHQSRDLERKVVLAFIQGMSTGGSAEEASRHDLDYCKRLQSNDL